MFHKNRFVLRFVAVICVNRNPSDLNSLTQFSVLCFFGGGVSTLLLYLCLCLRCVAYFFDQCINKKTFNVCNRWYFGCVCERLRK